MAGEFRAPTFDLASVLADDAERFDFFQALRWLEAVNANRPRLGESVKASDDAVRLGQVLELSFAASTLAAYESNDAIKPRLLVNFMGLFGPQGPLPLHLTEYARERARHHHDPTLVRFADIFHHRMISLFYRAWANARPTVAYDRPEQDRFAFYVGALQGIAGESFRHRDELDDLGKLFHTGLFAAQTKCADGLKAIIVGILAVPVCIEEFVGEWMRIEPTDYTRLGQSPMVASLGQSAVLGAFVWGCQHKFRVRLGPMALDHYLRFLPGGTALAQLKAIVRHYIGDEMLWDAQLVLRHDEVPPDLALGSPKSPDSSSMNGDARLGWSMWLGPRRRPDDASDLTLNPFIAVSTDSSHSFPRQHHGRN